MPGNRLARACPRAAAEPGRGARSADPRPCWRASLLTKSSGGRDGHSGMPRFPFGSSSKKKKEADGKEQSGAGPVLSKRVKKLAKGCKPGDVSSVLEELREDDVGGKGAVPTSSFVEAVKELMPKLEEAEVEALVDAFADKPGKTVAFERAFRAVFSAEKSDDAAGDPGPLAGLSSKARARLRDVASEDLDALREAAEAADAGGRGQIRVKALADLVVDALGNDFGDDDVQVGPSRACRICEIVDAPPPPRRRSRPHSPARASRR